jgi:hypothetical protein
MAGRRGGQANAGGDRMTATIENAKYASRPSARADQEQADGVPRGRNNFGRERIPCSPCSLHENSLLGRKKSPFHEQQGIRLRAIESLGEFTSAIAKRVVNFANSLLFSLLPGN